MSLPMCPQFPHHLLPMEYHTCTWRCSNY
jgi:hypothetical protein